MVGFHLVDGAGHWVQQEQPEEVSALLISFLRIMRRLDRARFITRRAVLKFVNYADSLSHLIAPIMSL